MYPDQIQPNDPYKEDFSPVERIVMYAVTGMMSIILVAMTILSVVLVINIPTISRSTVLLEEILVAVEELEPVIQQSTTIPNITQQVDIYTN